jgi:S-adenosylmethionine:tRNA ribosyltransferase-isomerase
VTLAAALTRFELPPGLAAGEPPEARGLRRDGVRLLVATPGGVRHTRFAELPRFLQPGDLVVVNTSATLPAAVDGHRRNRRPVTVHFSTALDDGTWLVELRPPGPAATGPVRDAVAGERVDLPDGATLTLLAGHPGGGRTSERLWRASICVTANGTGGTDGAASTDGTASTAVPWLLARHGRPVAYGYVPRRWPLSAYQTVFATDGIGEGNPVHAAVGSAEMPSAGRPFTTELVSRLVTRGIAVAPVTLHAGVSSLEKNEPPLAELYRVPPATARLVNATSAAGGRVVAVGTTVTRALETVADEDGAVTAGEGWTELVLGPDRPARTVDGLVTGWHQPGASHLLLLEAVAGPRLVGEAYRAAVQARYLWHEFGDSCLLLPDISNRT